MFSMITACYWEKDPATFVKYILPHVDAVLVRVEWNAIELSKGVYNFAVLDSAISRWTAYGKKVVVIAELVSDNIVAGGPNAATPAYVLAQSTIVTCSYNPHGVPVPWTAGFMLPAQSFIAAVLKHLSGNPDIFYVRIGFVEGGETCPICVFQWPNWSWPNFLTYIKTMCQFSAAVGAKVQFTQGAGGPSPAGFDAERFAVYIASGLGIGMQALSAADVVAHETTGALCLADWCAAFAAYPKAFKYLQTANAEPPGSLCTSLSFAKQFKVNSFEIYCEYLDIAYNPGNPAHAKWGAPYAAALANLNNLSQGQRLITVT